MKPYGYVKTRFSKNAIRSVKGLLNFDFYLGILIFSVFYVDILLCYILSVLIEYLLQN